MNGQDVGGAEARGGTDPDRARGQTGAGKPRIPRREFLKHSGLVAVAAVSHLRAHATVTGEPEGHGLPLRRYAQWITGPSGKPFKIGVYLEPGDWTDPTGVPAQVAAREFSHLANVEIDMSSSYRGPGEWDFAAADRVVREAEAARQSMIGMHLVWGSVEADVVPHWIPSGGFSRSELITIMEDHIAAVMTRYQGTIEAYTVVNEKYRLFGPDDWWYHHIGPEYLQIAFQKAREADPDATLIYNHYNNHTLTGQHYALTKADVDALGAQGLVDAVGVQLHLGSTRPAKTEVIEAMRSYGIPVWCTEFDSYQLSGVPDPEEEQALITKSMVEAAFESGVCDCFTNWGFSDKNSWWGAEHRTCLWDDNNNAKLSYYAVQQTLAAQAQPLWEVFLPIAARQ